MRGGGHDVRVRYGARMQSSGHESRDVRHIHEEERAHGLGGFGDALKIDHPRIGTCPGDDHFRLVLMRQPLDFVVVDALVFFAHAVGHELVHTAGKIQRMSVGQVTTMRQVHAQHSVPGLERGHVDRHVCGSTRMGLDIGVFRAKQLFGAVDRQLLHSVRELAAAVITLSRIALRVLVRED